MAELQPKRVIALDLDPVGREVIEEKRLSEILDKIGTDVIGRQVKSRVFRLQLALQESDLPAAREIAKDALKTLSLVSYPGSSEDTTDLEAAICHLTLQSERQSQNQG